MTAWELIGHDGPEYFRIKGGRTLYEEVVFNDSTHGYRVRLDRLVVTPGGHLRVINRYVDPDTEMELVPA